MDIGEFRQLVRGQTKLFLEKLLPRYLEKYYFGKGYLFLKGLLTDLDNERLLEIMNEQPPAPKWLARAKSILKKCPVRVSPELKSQGAGSLTLGQFLHREEYLSYANAYYVEKPGKRQIVIYQGSFEALRFASEDELRNEVLETIVHEFVHFFESYFLRSEQELGWREKPVKGLQHERMTFKEARDRDRRVERWKITRWMLAAIVLIAAVLVVVSGLK